MTVRYPFSGGFVFSDAYLGRPKHFCSIKDLLQPNTWVAIMVHSKIPMREGTSICLGCRTEF